jgi:hypothetical protein
VKSKSVLAQLTEQLIFADTEMLTLLCTQLSHLRMCNVGKQIVVAFVLQADTIQMMLKREQNVQAIADLLKICYN